MFALSTAPTLTKPLGASATRGFVGAGVGFVGAGVGFVGARQGLGGRLVWGPPEGKAGPGCPPRSRIPANICLPTYVGWCLLTQRPQPGAGPDRKGKQPSASSAGLRNPR